MKNYWNTGQLDLFDLNWDFIQVDNFSVETLFVETIIEITFKTRIWLFEMFQNMQSI